MRTAFRLSTKEGDGAWCPAGAVFPSESEYLQVTPRSLLSLDRLLRTIPPYRETDRAPVLLCTAKLLNNDVKKIFTGCFSSFLRASDHSCCAKAPQMIELLESDMKNRNKDQMTGQTCLIYFIYRQSFARSGRYLCVFRRITRLHLCTFSFAAGRPASAPLPGSGWYPGPPRRRPRPGVYPQLSPPLLPGRGEMAYVEGPLGTGCKQHITGQMI